MTGNQILETLRTYCPHIPFCKYAFSPAPGYEPGVTECYGILTENSIEKIVMGNRQKEELLDFTLDCYLYDDIMDEVKVLIENVFDLYTVAYDFNSIIYENEGLVHLTWDCSATYSLSLPPVRELIIHDTDGHIVVNYDLARVEDSALIPSNIRLGTSILGVEGILDPGGGQYDPYEGSYSQVSKTTETQYLETAGKYCLQDISIAPNETETILNPIANRGFTYIIK